MRINWKELFGYTSIRDACYIYVWMSGSKRDLVKFLQGYGGNISKEADKINRLPVKALKKRMRQALRN